MEFPERISKKATNIIAQYLDDASEQKLAEIEYGIAVFIANIYKIVFIFVLAYILNIFKYFIAAILSFGILRTFAAGVHAKREWTCLPASTFFLLGTVYLGMALKMNVYTISTVFALCFVVVLKYAPADTEERPLASRKLRKKLKLYSCITVIILYMISLYYLDTQFSGIIALSVVFESILILPVVYRLTNNVYGAGNKIKKEV